MNQPIHILTQMGILTSFSVSKKITEKDIRTLIRNSKKSKKEEHQITEKLKNKVMKEIKEAIENNNIPGLITPGQKSKSKFSSDLQNKLIELNKLVMVMSHKILEKKIDKISMCYIINTMVNVLGLSEKDFEEFQKIMINENKDEYNDEDGPEFE